MTLGHGTSGSSESKQGGGLVRRGGDPFFSLHRDMDRLFDDVFRDWGVALAPLRAFGARVDTYSPAVDVTETDQAVQASAELPGLDEKDVDVSLEDGVLTIRGEKKAEREERGKRSYRVERSYGSFVRAISLPSDVDEEQVQAVFKKGVLTITAPKTASAQRRVRKIEVKGA